VTTDDTAIDAAEIQSTFRRLTPERHPILALCTRDVVYDEGRCMAPGGLVLADAVGRHLDLQPGQSVLDLGCGRGQSSIFLAARYGVSVTSVDLWITADERRRAATAAGLAHRITPWQGDIRRGLPPETPQFDAIVCVQAFHTFGTSAALVRYLATLLGPGGEMCFAQGCFSEEFAAIPEPFRDTKGWQADYARYHSAPWWRAHVEASDAFKVEACAEFEDGDVMWEDDVLYRGDRAGWSADYMSRAGWLIQHIRHGQTNRPRLTHLLLKAVRRTPGASASDTLDIPGVQP
jgi:SAM-dependent methyltransferase